MVLKENGLEWVGNLRTMYELGATWTTYNEGTFIAWENGVWSQHNTCTGAMGTAPGWNDKALVPPPVSDVLLLLCVSRSKLQCVYLQLGGGGSTVQNSEPSAEALEGHPKGNSDSADLLRGQEAILVSA